MAYDYVTNCTGCKESLPRERVIWRQVVSRRTGLYYPGEPFCSDACYTRFTGEGADWAPPTAEQQRAFVRQMTVPL